MFRLQIAIMNGEKVQTTRKINNSPYHVKVFRNGGDQRRRKDSKGDMLHAGML
jgi:hypothetical protein